ncbi:hypothetical protein AVEN_117414-1 [Araneus ventricosus]|uniref:Uncharacterized protein n=1 Tax=Araneus ventricosus TaxID=182803 RepID=A0A4Y2E440_ARAVE|nr:hypothetical protein AVEN_117414-1 [Araneus ventricosus]
MATTQGKSNKALNSDSLVGQVSKDRKKEKMRKKKENALGLASSSGSADDFIAPQKSTAMATEIQKGFGPQVLSKVPVGPGRVEVPVKFGQTNPFALPQGDTPYPGSHAAASLPFSIEPAPVTEPPISAVVPPSPVQADSVLVSAADTIPETVTYPASETSLMPDGPQESLVPGTPQRIQEGLFQYGREEGFSSPTVDSLTLLHEESMDEVTNPGLKRKPDAARDRKKIVPKKKERTIDTLLLEISSSGSDRTVIVEDSQNMATVEGNGANMEVPSTCGIPLFVSCGRTV